MMRSGRRMVLLLASGLAVLFLAVPALAVIMPSPFKPPAMLSPFEQMARDKAALERVLKKRERLGLAADPENARLVKPLYTYRYEPKRDYVKQSCYHIVGSVGDSAKGLIHCDAERCTFTDGGYCEHKSRDCFDAEGKLILAPDGRSATDNEDFLLMRYDLCLAEDGSPVLPAGKKPYAERMQTGCAYRVDKPSPNYIGYKGYLMTCDAYRCLFHPSQTLYQRETNTYWYNSYESKTPPHEYFPYLNWTCIPPAKADRIASKYRCSIVVEDEANWGCEVCFERGKHVYKGCKYIYDEKGEQVGTRINIIPELLEQVEENLPPIRWAQMEKGRPNKRIMDIVVNLEILFRKRPVTDAAQKKAVALFADFFERKEASDWNDAKLLGELQGLQSSINRAIK